MGFINLKKEKIRRIFSIILILTGLILLIITPPLRITLLGYTLSGFVLGGILGLVGVILFLEA